MTTFAAWWPIEDDTQTLADLTTEATPDLHAMVTREGLTLAGPIRWGTDDLEAGLVLLAVAPVERDDETDDDTPARPALAEGKRPAEDLAEDVEWLLDIEPRASTARVCGRLGTTPNALSKALLRTGRVDLRDRLTHNTRVEQNWFALGDRPARKSSRRSA